MKASGSAYRKIAVWAVAISLLFSTAILARAGDDIRIYLGVVKQEIFASDGVDTTKRRSYLIVNQTVNEVAMITLADGTAFDATLDANVRITMPYNPAISKDSRTFIYIFLFRRRHSGEYIPMAEHLCTSHGPARPWPRSIGREAIRIRGVVLRSGRV